MDNKSILPKAEQLKHLKWVEIISQESQAIKLDSMYILEKNKEQCEVIFIDSFGAKRKVSGVSMDSINKGFASIDASNLTNINIEQWRDILKVLDLPVNVARVDDGLSNSVYNKEQIDDFNQQTSDLEIIVNQQGNQITEIINVNIEDDRRLTLLEGLNYTWNPTGRTLTLYNLDGTEMSQVSLRSLDNEGTDLRYNSATRSLELYNGDDELIDTIPVYEFVGNVATQLTLNTNTLQLKDSQGTVLSTVTFTVSNVGGLQAALDLKLDKPTIDGNLFLKKTAGVYEYKLISPQQNYLLFWNGEAFINSNAYYLSGKIGVGTTTPTEQLHLTARARMLALVLEDTAETLPQQLTYNNRKFWGTDSTGTKKQLLYKDFTDYKELWQSFTDAEKTTIKTIANGGWTTNTMSVFLINPLVINKSVTINQYVSLLGSNLNFLSTNFSVEIMDSTGLIVVALVPNSNVQLQSDGLSLVFHYNFNTIPSGNYKIRLNNGVAIYVTQVTFELRDTVDAYDLTNLIWTKKVYNDLKLPVFNTSPTSLNFNGDLKNIDDTDFNEDSISANITTVSAVSTAIGSMADDFVLELSLNNPTTYIYAYTSFGITVNGTENLIDDLLAKAVIGGWRIAAIGDGTTIIDANNSNSDRLLIVKRGQLMQYVIVGKTQSFSKIINVTNANVPFYLKMVRQNGGLTNGANTSISTGLILSAYKLN